MFHVSVIPCQENDNPTIQRRIAVKRVKQKARYLNETFMIKVVDGGKSSSLKEPSSLIDGTTEL
jgi:hypothetical protein